MLISNSGIPTPPDDSVMNTPINGYNGQVAHDQAVDTRIQRDVIPRRGMVSRPLPSMRTLSTVHSPLNGRAGEGHIGNTWTYIEENSH